MAVPERPRGRFLVLEGIDGSGKSSQLERLAAWLPRSGLMPAGASLVTSREPGGTPLGQGLRQLLLHPPEEAAPVARAELLLYAADRAQHVQSLIEPALAAGHWVLSDRFAGSTAAYQGHGRGLSLDLIDQLEAIATGGLILISPSGSICRWPSPPIAAAIEALIGSRRLACRFWSGCRTVLRSWLRSGAGAEWTPPDRPLRWSRLCARRCWSASPAPGQVIPMADLFADLIGQPMAVALMRSALERQRLAAAYLLTGPEGVGRRLGGLRFLEGVLAGPAGAPAVRRRLSQGNHPDLLWLEPTYSHQGRLVPVSQAMAEGVSKRGLPQIRLEQIRSVGPFLARRAVAGPRPVVVIEAVELMAEGAANGLLKTLEEPGAGLLLLLSAAPERLLSTIRSRCQQIPFRPLDPVAMAEVMERQPDPSGSQKPPRFRSR